MKGLTFYLHLFGIILPIAFPFLSPAETAGDDWPRWRGPNRDGTTEESGWNPESLKRDDRVLWKTNVGKGYSSMAVKGDYLYTLGNSKNTDTVYCLEANTGRTVWTHSYPGKAGQYPGPRATPTVDGGSVYTLSREGMLFCFDASNGKVRWDVDIIKKYRLKSPGWGFATSPVITGNLLLLNAGIHGLALDKRTGKKVWGSSGTGGYASPVLFEYNQREYAALFGEKALYVVDVRNGKSVASYKWITSYDVNAADPLVVGNRLFISSAYRKGCALLEFKGDRLNLLWENKRIKSHFGSPVFLDGFIYGIDGDVRYSGAQIRCLDIRNGEEMWGTKVGMASIIAADGKLVFLDGRGTLHIAEANPSSYTEISKVKVLGGTSWTPPAFSNGRIFCRNTKGELVCVDVRK